jgi:glutamate-1-semialdehyde aminotransferase
MKGSRTDSLVTKLRLGIIVGGVDMNSKPGGVMSCVHTDSDLEKTAEAVRSAVRMLKDEGDIAA